MTFLKETTKKSTQRKAAPSRFLHGTWIGPNIESLTPEQEALQEVVVAEYVDDLVLANEPNRQTIDRWLTVAYQLYSLPVPTRVEIADSPQAALKIATELTGEPQSELDWCGVGDGGWVSFYDYFHRIGAISDDEVAEVLCLRNFGRIAWDSILLDECAIVVRRPVELHLDSDTRLHSPDGPCIRWADGERDYAYHGTWVPERMILAPRAYSREEFRAISNTEERRALCEINGWAWVCEILGSKQEDSWTDPTTGLTYDLLSYEHGRLLRKQSPKLKSGAQPEYLEPVHEDLRTARGARKWQATGLTPAECELDPALVYSVES